MTIDWQRYGPPLAAAVICGLVWFRATQHRSARPARRSGDSRVLPSLPFWMGLAGAAWLWQAAGKPWLAAAAFAFGYAMTSLWRSQIRQRREETSEAEAMSVIGAANRAMRSGAPLAEVLATATAASAGEIQGALREVLHRERLGVDLASAMADVMAKVSQPEMRGFGLALAFNQEVGGNLVATSERLTRALTERTRVRRRARTIVAYSRTAALALTVVPFVAVTILTRMIPDYGHFLWATPGGNAMVATAAFLMLVGLRAIDQLAQLQARTVAESVR